MKIIRRWKVEEKTGRGHSWIYDKMKRGEFPRAVPLGGKGVGWVEEEIDRWIAARIAERDEPRALPDLEAKRRPVPMPSRDDDNEPPPAA
jgi:prophage regulatory protein